MRGKSRTLCGVECHQGRPRGSGCNREVNKITEGTGGKRLPALVRNALPIMTQSGKRKKEISKTDKKERPG